MFLSMGTLIFGLIFTEVTIKPVIASIGEIKASSMMVQTVNGVVREKYQENSSFETLLDFKTDSNGKVTLVQANSATMNKLSYELAYEIQRKLQNIQEERVQIPIGSIMGNQILSQTGPWVRLKILPLGTTKIAFKTELTDAGINQTKYKIHLEVINTAKVIVPFSDNQIQVETTMLVAEAVILGDIPDSFIVVPKEDILDAVNP
jgi:sporulation protein YunB